MKKILAALAAGLFAASLLSAQYAPPPAKPAVPGAKPATPAVPKKEEEPKIPGTVVTRADGTFLGLEVVGGNFKLSFYDKKKKLTPPTVTRASARWPNTRGPGDFRTILNSSGNALVGSKPVVPPFTFNVYLTLLKAEGDTETAVETLVVPFRG
jgi:hypothetical protein